LQYTMTLLAAIRRLKKSAMKLLILRCMQYAVLFITGVFSAMGTVWAQESDAYRIQPGDLLQISVWKEADMQREVLVQPDGRFSFPLIGSIDVRGKSVETLKTELEGRLGKLISDPVVTVAVIQTSGNKVFVIGQVNKPGEFVMNRRLDVAQALSMAGGMTTFASADDIKILRRNDKGEQTAIDFDYGDIQRGKKLKQNIILQGGDVVIVP
jgi:polysaccharide export outer membrane protein